MSKIRVNALAKQLGISSKEAIEKLAALGIEVKSHSSSVEAGDAEQLREMLKIPVPTPDLAPAPAPKKPRAKPAAPKQKVATSAAPATPPAPAAAPAPPAAAPAPPKRKTATRLREAVRRTKPTPGPVAVEPIAPAPPEPEAKTPEPAAPEPEPTAPEPEAPPAAVAGPVHVPRGVTVEEFARKLNRPPAEIIKMLLALGEMKTINQSLSDDAVELLAHELGADVQVVSVEEDEAEGAQVETDDPASLKPRAPIVTVMGHVDHGKSSILQQFRKKEMLSLEAGGITQAIGAYQVHGGENRVVTFIDTPGHEAFTQMRARGAQVTDIAILVVAADDGVQPQTTEALDHAKAAGVPVIVAVNKIDKPEADPMRVRQQLAEKGLQPEEWGGDTVFVDVSAKQGTNLDDLLDMIHLVSDMQELKANPDAKARGVAIEAHLDKGRGAVATLIVQRGTLKVGDPVVCGTAWCKVRALVDEAGKHVQQAGPSQPVLVTGWSKVPSAGDEFKVVADDRESRRITQEREAKLRQAEYAAAGKRMSLEELLTKTRAGEQPELKLIIKADTQGAIEALSDSIEKIDQAGVRITVLRKAAGAITENEINLAEASGAIVVGFNVRPDAGARQLAEKRGVDVRLYEVIYQLLEDIEKATRGLLAPEEEEVVTSAVEVRQLFRVPKGVVAGCYVTEGKVERGARARIIRDGAVIYTGEVTTLRRFKDDVREVAAGFECGIMISGYNDLKEGDVIETFEVREVARV